MNMGLEKASWRPSLRFSVASPAVPRLFQVYSFDPCGSTWIHVEKSCWRLGGWFGLGCAGGLAVSAVWPRPSVCLAPSLRRKFTISSLVRYHHFRGPSPSVPPHDWTVAFTGRSGFVLAFTPTIHLRLSTIPTKEDGRSSSSPARRCHSSPCVTRDSVQRWANGIDRCLRTGHTAMTYMPDRLGVGRLKDHPSFSSLQARTSLLGRRQQGSQGWPNS
ncbi:hypothetical protein BO70DRAFT_109309 [Aspergillus heteromorphus CBS 117.55]|uniref:Uncharacterized protein n=1 Tax=Aspergillus heteromorphus CBS 117.55 TaxID=1448321 RepID=A0A317VGY3_9EURO|nr:uncharacterized protein BO70DRAFT_109309 [Aspergillus heteromorphus CBS 117.55]PWY73626.1 hypothetical protein BO70DRAFT_109309 [Aspergillus heteromorphus CBS 117.55]